jgi:glutamate N-acetyltransferase/amino-acid N-acetyltransferase
MKTPFMIVKGSVTAAHGFRAAGMAAGLKSTGRKDLALIVSDVPATVAATFTTNQVKAAPVQLDIQHVAASGGMARAIVANSGNANACTGKIGNIHARAMAVAVARRIKCPEEQVLVCSTGRIGVNLPIVKIETGIKKLLKTVSRAGAREAAQAIMTSDTRLKEVAVRLKLGARTVHIGGIAKGAGMIHPKMATMLVFLTTDAVMRRAPLQHALSTAVKESFNRISVDGDTSTNDTVLLLANGASGGKPLTGRAVAKFQEALNFVCLELAKKMVLDGEGVTKFVTVNVHGAVNDHHAELAARAVVNSVLVKTSWCGGDPNWGRIMDAIGYSRAKVRGELVEIAYNGLLAVRHGMATKVSPQKLRKIVKQPVFTIDVHLRLGRGHCTMHSCDLTEKYVEFNKGE